MNKFYPLALICILISSFASANGDIRFQEERRQDQTEKTRERMKENPRNLSFPGSFGQIHTQNESQERQEEKAQWLDELTEGTYWDNGNSATTNKKEEYGPREL